MCHFFVISPFQCPFCAFLRDTVRSDFCGMIGPEQVLNRGAKYELDSSY
jgi:hypothetical protein